MMQVLLVDDDRYIVSALEQQIDWQPLGFTKVWTAYNMVQSQKILAEEAIDLVVSDIEMPQGSGLELLAWMRKQKFYQPLFVFLTNYADFNYAQKALEYQSFDYVLKPVDPDEFTLTVKKAVKRIQEDAARRTAGSTQPSTIWRQYVTGRIDSADQAKLPQHTLNIVSWCHADHATDLTHVQEVIWRLYHDHFTFAAFQLVSFFHIQDRNYGLIFSTPSRSENTGSAQQAAQQFQQKLKELGISVSLLTSPPVPFTKLPQTYSKIHDMAEKRAIHRGTLMSLADYQPQADTYVAPDYNQIRTLLTAHNPDAVIAYFRDYLRRTDAAGQLTRDNMARLREDFIQLMYVALQAQQISVHELFKNDTFAQLQKRSLNSIESLLDFIAYLVKTAVTHMTFIDRHDNVALQLKNYIDQHLGDDLSREVLADLVFLNPDYTGRLFKEEYGLSLTSYIIQQRVQQAEYLLIHTNLTIQKIAETVGYTNFSYFTKMFKKVTNMPPMQYRQEHQELK